MKILLSPSFSYLTKVTFIIHSLTVTFMNSLPVFLHHFTVSTDCCILPQVEKPCVSAVVLIPVSLPWNLPCLLPFSSPQQVRLVVQTAAICSALQSPPPTRLLEGVENRGHISEMCWFCTVSRSLLYHPPRNTALLPEQTVEHQTTARCVEQW